MTQQESTSTEVESAAFADAQTDVEKQPDKSIVSAEDDEEIKNVNTSDEQIEAILKETEDIRIRNSPKKVQPDEDSNESTPNSTVLSTGAESSISDVTTSPPPTISAEGKPDSATSTVTTTPSSTGPIPSKLPNSVSQALFSKPLKVTKVREKSATPKFIGLKQPEDPAAVQRFDQLQTREYELTKKIHKVQKEIDYLKELIETASITSDLKELRKLKYAVERLDQYLDAKQKEKYEVGIQLTRAVRKRVDSGELGEYWST